MDCGVLIGQECPILAQLLQRPPRLVKAPANPGFQLELVGIELLVRRGDSARLTTEDPSLQFQFPARAAAREQPLPATAKDPSFTMDWGPSYRWFEGKSQVVVPTALRPCVLSLAHVPPPPPNLAGHLEPGSYHAAILLARSESPGPTVLLQGLQLVAASGQRTQRQATPTHAVGFCPL